MHRDVETHVQNRLVLKLGKTRKNMFLHSVSRNARVARADAQLAKPVSANYWAFLKKGVFALRFARRHRPPPKPGFMPDYWHFPDFRVFYFAAAPPTAAIHQISVFVFFLMPNPWCFFMSLGIL